jgi:hypothetical protein
MNVMSPWFLSWNNLLNQRDLQPIYETQEGGINYQIFLVSDACWLIATCHSGCRIGFLLAYSPGDTLELASLEGGEILSIAIDTAIGKFAINIGLPGVTGVLHYTTRFKPNDWLLIPYWPRDIMPLGEHHGKRFPKGEIYVRQVGTRSGQLYFSIPETGAIFYHQNLTALAEYNQQTETTAAETVGGEWPEIGFALPPTRKNKPLEPAKSYIINDAFVAFSKEVPTDESTMVYQYLDLLAKIYLALPKPVTNYKDWPTIIKNGLKDLTESPGCWSQLDGHHYFNAYVSDYVTPPEIMVQLAVLMPLLDYVEWSGDKLEVMRKIKEGLPSFYDDKLKTIMRWHPKAADKLEGEEEQKEPLTMDSWYLHHPLLNLSRLALKGDRVAKKLFLDSLGFAIHVARHFKYHWPVFYKMDTLEVVKAETQPGKGGEKDTAGLYAHVMLQAWELTGERKFLAEAEKAALKLKGLGFDLFYQANNTSFSAGALLRLYKITKKQTYLDLSYLCLANILKNVRLWDCNYGFGKNFPSFFALFPLNDAPYTAVYEEQEVFCALHDYLWHAATLEIDKNVRLLIAEFIRYLVDRAVYYYPPMLPDEMLQEKPKIGEVDRKLWIALEDLHDGWEASGQVGQEVYGAGNAFGIMPRHYMQVPGGRFFIFTDYPIEGFKAKIEKPARFKLAGDGRLQSRLMIVKTRRQKLPDIQLTINQVITKGKTVSGGNLEFIVPGDATITINWD